VHDAVAVGEDEATVAPGSEFDRGYRRPRVVDARDEPLELAGEALAGRVGQQAAAAVEFDGDRCGPVVAPVPREQDRRRQQSSDADRRGEEEGGPGSRAALPFVVLTYLIVNVALPVVWFPAMSVAIHRNSVVLVTTND
jgi:hypothetical protein